MLDTHEIIRCKNGFARNPQFGQQNESLHLLKEAMQSINGEDIPVALCVMFYRVNDETGIVMALADWARAMKTMLLNGGNKQSPQYSGSKLDVVQTIKGPETEMPGTAAEAETPSSQLESPGPKPETEVEGQQD